MNASFNKEFRADRYYGAERKSNVVSFPEFIILIITLVSEFLRKETVQTAARVAVSLSCLAGLFSVVHFFESGVLSVAPAIILALALLAVVAFCFRNEN